MFLRKSTASAESAAILIFFSLALLDGRSAKSPFRSRLGGSPAHGRPAVACRRQNQCEGIGTSKTSSSQSHAPKENQVAKVGHLKIAEGRTGQAVRPGLDFRRVRRLAMAAN